MVAFVLFTGPSDPDSEGQLLPRIEGSNDNLATCISVNSDGAIGYVAGRYPGYTPVKRSIMAIAGTYRQ